MATNKVYNRSNPGKTSRSCEGADYFSWWSSKVSRTLNRESSGVGPILWFEGRKEEINN
jgi:hypothetical protein